MEDQNRGRQVSLLRRGEPQDLADKAEAQSNATRGSQDPKQRRGYYIPVRLPLHQQQKQVQDTYKAETMGLLPVDVDKLRQDSELSYANK